jgi:hypothetical protein
LDFRLGREERFKDVLDYIRWNPAPGIGDRNHQILARINLGVSCSIVSVEKCIARLNGELAMPIHCIPCIDCEIQNYILNLHGISKRVPKSAGDNRVDFNPVAQGSSEHIVNATDQAAD